MRIGILGGGLSGLALQWFLKHPSEVLEAAPEIGGLCKTFWKDGFGYDLGGHILFSKHEAISRLVEQLLAPNLNRCRRANRVLFKGRYVKYPFENDLAALEPEDCYQCLIGYLQADFPAPENFAEWMLATFGRGITEAYLLPYNRKIWKLEPDQMGVEWVERIPKPPLEDVVKSALGIPTEGYTHQLYFQYPLYGGIASLVQALRRPEATVVCDAPVQEIRRDGSGWLVTDTSQTRAYEHLVITFPVHEAVRCFRDVPWDVRRAVAELRYNALRVALIGVNNPSLLDKSAVYIPDPEVLPHRVCFMGFFSPHLVPQGTSSLIAEITANPGGAVDSTSDAVILERTVNDLDRVGIVSRRDVIATDLRRCEYAYPIYDLKYTRNVALVRSYFSSLGVELLGRFAEFDYINMDECLRRAGLLADRLNQRLGTYSEV